MMLQDTSCHLNCDICFCFLYCETTCYTRTDACQCRKLTDWVNLIFTDLLSTKQLMLKFIIFFANVYKNWLKFCKSNFYIYKKKSRDRYSLWLQPRLREESEMILNDKIWSHPSSWFLFLSFDRYSNLLHAENADDKVSNTRDANTRQLIS